MVRNDIDLNLKNGFNAMPTIITKKLLWLVGSLMIFFDVLFIILQLEYFVLGSRYRLMASEQN